MSTSISRRMMPVAVALAGFAIAAAPAAAQSRGGGPAQVPPGQMPPAGQCRVWYANRAPGQQPGPTSCATAERLASRTGGSVLYGSGTRRTGYDQYGHATNGGVYTDRDAERRARVQGQLDPRNGTYGDTRTSDRDRRINDRLHPELDSGYHRDSSRYHSDERRSRDEGKAHKNKNKNKHDDRDDDDDQGDGRGHGRGKHGD